MDPQETIEAIRAQVVGREPEIELILAAVNTGRDLLLEGPPGTSKTTLLKAITGTWGIPLIFAEGSAELTPGRLLGHHDPARVLREGYSEETFDAGPLVQAMQEGGFLYFEEFNRAPEDTLNTLLTAIADREVTIPRVGKIVAAPSFRLVGSMNPHDNVGTTRLSVSIKDRLNRLTIGYQDAAAERKVVELRCGSDGSALAARILDDAVTVVRRTREHDAVAQGSSVRGAIDLRLMAAELCAVRGIDSDEDRRYPEAFFEVMLVALSGRLMLDHASGASPEAVLREIWEDHFLLVPAGPGGSGELVELAPSEPIGRREEAPGDRAKRPVKARPKELNQDPELTSGAGGQGLAAGPRDPSRLPDRRPGGTGFSDEGGQLDDEEGEQRGPSRRARAAAQEIAARLAIEAPEPLQRPSRGGEEILSLPYNGAGGEIDIDRTLDALLGQRELSSGEVIVREPRRTGRQVVLAVDVSGSMRGERLLTAAATVGALSAAFGRDDLAVIAFWSDAAVLLRLGERAPLDRLVDEMVGLQAAGLTNIAFPLEVAARELGGPGDREQRVLLLSDCVHNAGPDPRAAAARLPRLDLLFEVGGERDSDLARGMAHVGRGTVAPILGHRDVAPALSRILSGD